MLNTALQLVKLQLVRVALLLVLGSQTPLAFDSLMLMRNIGLVSK